MTASNAISRPAAQGDPLTSAASSSSTDEAAADGRGGRFSLSGPARRLDPRVHAFRRDIADVALAGQVIASHYARAMPRSCGTRTTALLAEPQEAAQAVSELLPGEGFCVLEYTGPWAWGYCAADRRVGYVEAIELVEPFDATHVVCEASAPAFADAAIGAAKLATFPLGARLRGHEHGACLLSEMGCVPLSHLRRIDELECDPAGIATKLIHAPWRSGGRTGAGIDAAGLIQLALGPCGIACPRDLDQQRTVGNTVPDDAPLRRGDLVIAGDEGGVMVDDLMLVHASRDAGRVVAEPATALVARNGGEASRRRTGI